MICGSEFELLESLITHTDFVPTGWWLTDDSRDGDRGHRMADKADNVRYMRTSVTCCAACQVSTLSPQILGLSHCDCPLPCVRSYRTEAAFLGIYKARIEVTPEQHSMLKRCQVGGVLNCFKESR